MFKKLKLPTKSTLFRYTLVIILISSLSQTGYANNNKRDIKTQGATLKGEEAKGPNFNAPEGSPDHPSRYRITTGTTQGNTNTITQKEEIKLTPSSLPVITIPLNIYHIEVTSQGNPNSKLPIEDSSELIDGLNNIYQQFGIQWEPQAQDNIKISGEEYSKENNTKDLKSFVTMVTQSINKKSTPSASEGLTIYVISKFPEGVNETALAINKKNSVLAALKTPNAKANAPAILAHELAQCLGLSDIGADNSNLMSKTRPSSIQATKLYSHQLALLRKKAKEMSRKASSPVLTKSSTSAPNNPDTEATPKAPSIFRQSGYTPDY